MVQIMNNNKNKKSYYENKKHNVSIAPPRNYCNHSGQQKTSGNGSNWPTLVDME